MILQILFQKPNMKKMDQILKKIPDLSNLVKKTDFNPKIAEVENKIPSISGLATTSALTVVEKRYPASII